MTSKIDFKVIGSIVLIVAAGVIISVMKLDTFMNLLNISEKVIELIVIKNKNA